VYRFCDIEGKGIVNLNSLTKFILNLNSSFQEKEVFALINYLDRDKNKKISKEVFLGEVEKAMKLSGKKDGPISKRTETQALKEEKLTKPPVKQPALNSQPIQSRQNKFAGPSKVSRERDDSETRKEIINIKRIIVKMELGGNPIYQFLK
jgi:hypothetical protein